MATALLHVVAGISKETGIWAVFDHTHAIVYGFTSKPALNTKSVRIDLSKDMGNA